MTEPRPSRIGWPAMERRAPGRRRKLALGALYVAVVLNLVLSLLLFAYVIVLKSARDTEQQRVQQQIRDSWCMALDTLPEGGLLDTLRAKYHCGPGIPISQLPPAVQQRLNPPAPVPQSLKPLPAPLPSGTSPGVSRDAPGTLPPRTGPGPGGPTPTPPSPDPTPPPSPLRPVTGPVCDLTGLCF